MMRFMIEGGFGMWPILLFGLVLMYGAVRFAITPTARWLGFVAAMWVTVATAAVGAMITDFATVMRHLAKTALPWEMLVKIMYTGLKESTRPGALACIFLTLAPLALAIGAFRWRQTEG